MQHKLGFCFGHYLSVISVIKIFYFPQELCVFNALICLGTNTNFNILLRNDFIEIYVHQLFY